MTALQQHMVQGRLPILFGLLVLGFLMPLSSRSQTVMKGFKVPDYENEKLTSLLRGAEAVRESSGLIRLKDPVLELFEKGESNLVVTAESCVYDNESRITRGTGRITAVSISGQLTLSGTGFEWRQSDGVLTLSNQVETVLSPGENAEVPVRVQSQRARLDHRGRSVVYEGSVVAREGERLTLTSQILEAFLPESGRKIQHLVARKDVEVQFSEEGGVTRKARGGHAEFFADQDRVVLTETPVVEWNEAKVEAGRIEMFRTRKRFELSQGVRLDWFGPEANRSQSTQVTSKGATWDEKDLLASFQGDVKARQPDGSLLGGDKMEILLASERRGFRRLVVESKVWMEFEGTDGVKRQARAGRALYDPSDGRVVMTSSPSIETLGILAHAEEIEWNRGTGSLALDQSVRVQLPSETGPPVEIQADRGQLDAATRTISFEGGIQVVDPAGYRLSSERLKSVLPSKAGLLSSAVAEGRVVIRFDDQPDFVARGARAILAAGGAELTLEGNPEFRSERMVATSDSATYNKASRLLILKDKVQTEIRGAMMGLMPEASVDTRTQQRPVLINSDGARLDQKAQKAFFEGHVKVQDSAGAEMTAGRLAVDLPETNGAVRGMKAEDDVIIRLPDADGNISVAQGRQAEFFPDSGELHLTGEPSLQSGEVRGWGKVLVYQPATSSLRILGQRRIEFRAPADAGKVIPVP